MRLKRDLEVFSDNLVVDGVPNVDTSHIYKGYLIGEFLSYKQPLK